MIKKISFIIIIFALINSFSNAYAELTASDMEKIRQIVKDEISHVDKRFGDMNSRFEDINRRFEDINKRFEDINRRFEDVNSRIDELSSRFNWGFGLIFAGIFTLIGFVLWDRRSALAPAIRKSKELEEKGDKIERVLKEFAGKNKELAEIMKTYGLF